MLTRELSSEVAWIKTLIEKKQELVSLDYVKHDLLPPRYIDAHDVLRSEFSCCVSLPV